MKIKESYLYMMEFEKKEFWFSRYLDLHLCVYRKRSEV